MILDELAHPIVQAPMGGGPSTPALAAAVAEAGGLGFLAAGYKPVEAVRADVEALRALTDRPFGINLFAPPVPAADDVAPFAAELEGEAARYGVPVGEPRHDDDGWDAKLALVRELEVPVVSFTFGCPPAGRPRGPARGVGHRDHARRGARRRGRRRACPRGAGRRGGRPPRDLRRRRPRRHRPPRPAPARARDGRSPAGRDRRDRHRPRGRRRARGGRGRRPARDRVHALPGGRHRPGAPRRDRRRRRHRPHARVHRPHGARRGQPLDARAWRASAQRLPRRPPPDGARSAPPRASRATADGFHLWAGQAHTLARPVPAGELVRQLAAEAQAALREAAGLQEPGAGDRSPLA